MRRSLGLANTKGSRRGGIASALRRRPAAVISMIGVIAVFTGAVMSRVDEVRRPQAFSSPPTTSATPMRTTSSRLHSRLSFQPEANKMRRRLGQRFIKPGREVSLSTGTLTLDGQTQPINIVRTQDDQYGEHVAIALAGGALLSWNPRDGPTSNGAIPASKARSVVERIALDSPDQFVLAQTRGASYFPIAQNVLPVADDNYESYSGPSWNLVRIAEPQQSAFDKPDSIWRIYYINSATSLIDKILYDDQGTVIVELLEWTS